MAQLNITNSKGNTHTKKSISLMWENIKREMDIEMGAETYRNKITENQCCPRIEGTF